MSELADFVLDAFRQAGGIVEPPAYGFYEALLPEEAARRWGVPAYQRLGFSDDPPPEVVDLGEGVILGYGHPLVETLVEDLRAEPACTQVYINDVRLDKRGLFELAHETLTFPNAHLSQAPRGSIAARRCHYVRFNFKAALITDEKRERLVAIVMDAQSGLPVPALIREEGLIRLEEKPAFEHLAPAPVRWLPGQRDVLSLPVLQGLLERASRAAVDELADVLASLRQRAARHLELDRARLTEYYDDIARDLGQRIERTTDDARRASLEDKLVAVRAEREAKLADVEAKYRLRVELELINLQVIVQPKLLLPVLVGDRAAKVERTVVWDPLLHRVEPWTCDVCGRAATRLMLCSGGHLVHEGCLLPEQCVDCKRVYCRRCAEQIGECVVCHRPVCVHSLNRCDTCGRGTCHAHVGLCHAADGEPASLPPAEPPPPRSAQKEKGKRPPESEATGEERKEQGEGISAPTRRETGQKKRVEPTRPDRSRRAGRAARQARSASAARSEGPKPYKIEVYVEPQAPVVNAFVLTRGKKQIAVRSWELTDQGIEVICRCEKWYSCPVHGRVLKPARPSEIESQIEAQIEELRQEYGVSTRQVFRYAFIRSASRQVPRIVLRGAWRAED
ncbi:MAG TPA: hypothetical protein ENN99_02395 [Chloroflexi bacterium]|nr:hypothetical protein [Chloroflexota bacterium]